MARYTVADVDSVEGEGPGGAVRKMRRALGAQAFGFNYFTIPAGVTGLEHDHTDSGQEEISVVVRGGGHWRVDGEDVAVREGSVVRFDPETTRCPVAGADGLAFFSVGARRGGYEPHGSF